MFAIVITLVGLMGLLQAVNVAMEHNLRNQLRDEAVLVGEQAMGFQKVRPFDQISTASAKNIPPPFTSRLRSGKSNFYRVTCEGTDLATAKQLIVTVKWTYRGVEYSHQVRSIRSQ